MRIALAVHAWPSHSAGGVERSVRCLARALARAGHAVCVIAGSCERAGGDQVTCTREREPVPGCEASLELVRVQRPDLYFDHWHKSRSPEVAQAAARILREHASEVLHVHHWLRLSRDLVQAAAREGVPAVVTLHDAWTSCPLAFRVRSADRATCTTPVAADACVACAGRVPPRTPWVDTARGWMALAERQRDLGRELELARAVIAPSAFHAAELERTLGRPPGSLGARVLAPARQVLEAAPGRSPRVEPPSEGRLRLVSWGALSEHKGSDLLLAALAELGDPAGYRLDLFGDGERDFVHDLRNAAVGVGARFHAGCEPSELAAAGVADAHAFVSGTRAVESYGLVVDEAFELGLPAVLPDQGAFLERCGPLDPSGCGDGTLFYARGDARALATALRRLREEPGLWTRLASAASARGERARRSATVAEHLAAHLELYARAVAAGAPQVAPPEWFEARLATAELSAWDAALSRCSSTELGCES